MRIVIDLQGAQSASRFRGIGRYSLALALGVARNAGSHEVWLVMNGALADSIPALRRAFAALVPPERMRVFDIATPAAELHPADGWRARANEQIREYAIGQLRPDVVLATSLFEGFVDDAICSVGAFTDGAHHAVVLYDLIPFLNPAAYLGSEAQRHYYERKIASLRRAGLLLAISDYSRQEAIDALGLDPERVVSISTAVDERFAPAEQDPGQLAALRARYGITRAFIMYAPGGFDKRKNIDGLVSAYSRLAPPLRGAHQLLIASKLQPNERDDLERHAARCGLRADELVLTDYVDDDTLMALYRASALFVFPSLHEGFGLPALEAMACGALVIGGDNTSLPEVIGSPEAMFDAADVDAIAARIAAVLGDAALRARLRENGRAQAARFSWDRSAQRALAALERHAARTPAPAPARTRRRLAFVSPLPPERTGIADYAAQCLPALCEWFDITLIVQQSTVTLPDSLADLARHDAAWFAERAGSFDQILYQFGNSPFHSHMFALLERFPGVVVLHDFYLSSVLAYEQMTGAMPRVWIDALYRSHGYGAVRAALAPGGAEAAKLAYPCNLEVLQQADALIVHSSHARELACQWYGPQAGAGWHLVPLPRSVPAQLARAEARKALGIRADTLLVCSFGFVDATKLSHRLLDAWNASALRDDPACELVFVGANHGGAYGKELLDAIGANRRVRIAGWTEDAQYRQYLQAADIGVQLRAVSRGETSAAVLDCMNYGLATIVNANGSMAALPDQAVWKLPDDFALEELTAALETLRRDAAERSALGARGAAAIEAGHRPEYSAARYAEVLDAVARQERHGMRALTQRIGAALPDDERAFQQMADSLSLASHGLPRPRQLLVDVTNIVRQDLGTGIERVVRMQLLELLAQSGPVRVEPVYLSQQGGRTHYRYAQQYACRLLGIEPVTHADEAIDVHPGDLFYAPDYAPAATLEAAAAGIYAGWRARGLTLTFLIHDLLPVLQPDFFPSGAAASHAAWLACIGVHADRLLCISQAVADETRTWMAGDAAASANGAAIAVLHHGADLGCDAGAAPPEAHEVLAQLRAVPSVLMVGTIEPRKGHLQALDAFEQLWREGVQVNLAIVGHEGWKALADSERRTIPLIVERLRQHPELGRRLFWLKGIDDAYLQQVYQASACLLAASEGEGFGLPLIEAARYGLPVIARDIPVFREVAQDGAWYFSGAGSAPLAASLRGWLARFAAGTHPPSGQVPQRSWRDNAAQLMRLLSDAG